MNLETTANLDKRTVLTPCVHSFSFASRAFTFGCHLSTSDEELADTPCATYPLNGMAWLSPSSGPNRTKETTKNTVHT